MDCLPQKECQVGFGLRLSFTIPVTDIAFQKYCILNMYIKNHVKRRILVFKIDNITALKVVTEYRLSSPSVVGEARKQTIMSSMT